jgi:exodeoxyribonuclease VII large subunit
MPSMGENPPTLASLRSRRGSRRSTSKASISDAPDLQAGFFFEDPEPPAEPAAPPQPGHASAIPGPPASAPLPIERKIWTVADLVTRIRHHVESEYADLWVEGEISNCRLAPSGHIYFTLKDGDAQLLVVLFRRQASLLRFRPADGLAVLVRGRISVYESRGQLQLIAETFEPRGAGALQLAFEQLKARLLAEGLFDASRKRPLPAFPRCIGIVTSPAGAVIRDIVTVIRRRHARLKLLVYPAVVQGSASPGSVAKGIRWFNRHSELVDAIVLARGGGSMEDLAGFNDEALARTIAASKLPIVSAIGHETDFTIADFVADLRAPTPSAAAEMITAMQHRIEERIDALEARARRAIHLRLLQAGRRYARLSAESVLLRLRDSIGHRLQRVDELDLRLGAAMHRRTRSLSQRLGMLNDRLRRQDVSLRIAATRHRLERLTDRLQQASIYLTAERRSHLNAAVTRLHALSPLSVLARGYALVYSSEGILLRSADETAAGQTIRARLSRGSLEAQVIQTKPQDIKPTENSTS